jgi:hypothetical protein
MKTHIGPIYLILGLMAVSSLAIGAGKTPTAPNAPIGHAVHAQALLPSPSSFRFEVTQDGRTVPARLIVIGTSQIEDGARAQIEAKVAKALAAARVRKAG